MRLIERTPSKRYFISLFVIVATLFLVFSGVIYRNYTSAQTLQQWTLYNYEVLRRSRKILLDLVDMETGVRGYMLTRDASFLKPFQESRATLGAEITNLQNYTVNDPDATSNMTEWLTKISTFASTLNQQVNDLATRGAPLKMNNLITQKQQLDNLRADLEGFMQSRLSELQTQINEANAAQHNFIYVLAIGTVLAIAGMLLVTLILVSLINHNERARAATRELEERFITVMSGVNDGVFDFDPIAKTIYYSPQYKAMLGYEDDELPNSLDTFKDAIHLEDADAIWETSRRYQNREIPTYRNVFRMRHKDGHWLWVLSRGIGIFDEKGVMTRLIGTHTDITEQKHREEELAAVNSEMETFTYITSHDLRSPLVNLKGFASELGRAVEQITPVIERKHSHFSNEEQAILHNALEVDIPESIKFITQSVAKMDALTTAVLDLTRIGKREYHREYVDIEAVMQRCLDSTAYEISRKHVTITREHLPSIISDALALEQVFSNILGNAIKYLDPDRPGHITIEARENPTDITYIIRDNGRGIAPEDHDKVFQIFRRARNAHNVEGMGMGMAFVQATIRRIGGSVWFTSNLGQGTEFFIKLPKIHSTKGTTL